MTYRTLIKNSHKFNNDTKYSHLPLDAYIARYQVIEGILKSLSLKTRNIIIGDITIKRELYKGEELWQVTQRAFEGKLAETIVTLSCYFAHFNISPLKDIDCDIELVDAFSEISKVVVGERIEMVFSDMIQRMAEANYRKDAGLMECFLFIAYVVAKFNVLIDEHLEILFKYSK